MALNEIEKIYNDGIKCICETCKKIVSDYDKTNDLKLSDNGKELLSMLFAISMFMRIFNVKK